MLSWDWVSSFGIVECLGTTLAPLKSPTDHVTETGASPHLLGAPDICCQLCGEVELDQGLPRWR